MRFPRSDLGVKLNLSLLAFFVALGAAMALLVLFGFRRSQHDATTRSREGLEAQGRRAMLGFVDSDANIGQYIVNQAVTKGHDAARYLEALPPGVGSAPQLSRTDQGALYDASPDRVTDVWIPASVAIDGDAERDLRDSAGLDALFPVLFQRYGEGFSGNDTVSLYYMSPSGVRRSYPRAPGDDGTVAADLTPSQRAALRGAGPTGNPQRVVVWSDPYEGESGRGLLITAYTPVYAGDAYRGVIGADLSITSLLAQADAIRVTEHSYAFVIDRNGNLLPGLSHDIIAAAIADHDNTAFSLVLQHMRGGESNADRAVINGQEVFVAYAPLGSFGGSLALVAPISDVTAEASTVTGAIDSAGNRTVAITLATMSVFFAVALFGAAWLNRLVLLRPIAALVRGTRGVAGGDLDVSIPASSRDELGDLAISFNMMTDEIRHRRDALRAEIEERERTQNELDALFSAMTDIVLVLDKEGTYLRQAPTRAARHPVARKRREMILGRTVFDILDNGQGEGALACIRSALSTGRTESMEYSLAIEGELRWYSASISPLTADTVVWVARDITERVAAQQLLERRVDERTRELTTLLDVARDVSSTLEVQPLLSLLLDQIRGVAGFDRAAFMLLQGDELEIVSVMGPPGGNDPELTTHLGMRFRIEDRARLWRPVREGRPVIIDDVRSDSADAKAYRAAVGTDIETRFASVRAWMAVPVASRERVVGMVVISRQEPGFYNERHAQLATAIASQAAIAIENARLFEETQRRAREVEALLQVSRNIATQIELQPLLELVLDQVRAIADYDRAGVMVLEQGLLVVRALRDFGSPSGYQSQTRLGMAYPLRDEPLFGPRGSKAPVIIDDILAEDPLATAYRGGEDATVDFTKVPHGSYMAIPLVAQDRVVGAITMARDEVGFFTQEHARLARAIASQVAVAIENARLFEQTEERTRELTAVLDVSRAVASTLELRRLVRVILDQLRALVEYTGSSILTIEGDDLVILDSRGPLGEDREEDAIGVRFPLTDAPAFWQTIAGGGSVIIDDVRGSSAAAAGYRAALGDQLDSPAFRYVRGWMAAPIAHKDRVIGMLSMSSSEPNHFTEAHVRLARAIADQAAVAIENARLFAQTEGKTRELTALLDVSRGIASTLDQRQLVGEILRQIRNIIDYNGASVLIREGDMLRVLELDTTNFPADIPPQQPWRFPMTRMRGLWEAMQRGEQRIIPDVRADTPDAQRYRFAAGELYETGLQHVRAWLGVPLVRHDQAIGMLTLSHAEPGFFTEDHARIVRAIADQAAVAIENARLFAETQERSRQTEALIRADEQLFGSLDLDAVFQALVDVCVDVLGVPKSMVTTLDDADSHYTIRASRNISQWSLDTMTAIRTEMPRTVLPTIVEPMVSEDARSGTPEMLPVFEAEGIYTTVDVPIRSAGTLRGMLGAGYTTAETITPDELRLLQALAERAALAIENAELFKRAQQVASLEERQRLARDLHDSVSQGLYGIALGARTARTMLDRDPAGAAEPLEYVLSLADAGLAEMRALIFELRPESLETEGVVAAIEKQIAATRSRYGIDVTAILSDEPDATLEVKEAIYRIAQEALHNTIKHAQAKRVDVTLACSPNEVRLILRDDGRGFDPDGSFPGHIGLSSMRERAARARASISIESAPGTGTRIEVRAPLR